MKDRRYYSVQVGDDYTDDYGSTIKREAFRMARREKRANPDEEVRIVLRTVEDDYCDGIIYVELDDAGEFWYKRSWESWE